MNDPICPTCTPEAVPGPGDLPSDAYTYVTLNGQNASMVAKAQSGEDGWVLQVVLKRGPSGHSIGLACPNGPHWMKRLLRGNVQYQHYPSTIPAAGAQNQES